jgi:hypothetical protein
MKKAIIVLLALAAFSTLAFAQAATPAAAPAAAPAEIGSPNPSQMGIETAQQELKEISVDKFEAAGFWDASISSDEGVVTARLFEGQPADAKANPLKDDPRNNEPTAPKDKYVLGVKTEFYARGYNEISILAKRPVPVEGITKVVSVWVAGRNYNHVLWLELQDFFGYRYELPMGKLNFQGWKKLSVAIPPQNPDGRTGIVQRNFHYTTHMGLKIVGFRIQCDPEEAFGTYYIYLDDLRAVSDLFAEDTAYRDRDDMPDTW